MDKTGAEREREDWVRRKERGREEVSGEEYISWDMDRARRHSWRHRRRCAEIFVSMYADVPVETTLVFSQYFGEGVITSVSDESPPSARNLPRQDFTFFSCLPRRLSVPTVAWN